MTVTDPRTDTVTAAVTDPLATFCDGCHAYPGEPCHPGCLALLLETAPCCDAYAVTAALLAEEMDWHGESDTAATYAAVLAAHDRQHGAPDVPAPLVWTTRDRIIQAALLGTALVLLALALVGLHAANAAAPSETDGRRLPNAPATAPAAVPAAPDTDVDCWDDTSCAASRDGYTVTDPGPAPLADMGTIYEDDPRWDCRTMGNRVCGPRVPVARCAPSPAPCPGTLPLRRV